MAFPLVALAGAVGGKFINKALGHGARAKRASGEKQIAAQEGVSYECVRRIDASIAAGTAHPLYLNLGRAGGKTSVGDEIACYHAAQDLGAQFTGREFDDASGKPLSVTHPEFYDTTAGTVPANTGSPVARGIAAGIADQVAADNRPMYVYDANGNLINPVGMPMYRAPGPVSSGTGTGNLLTFGAIGLGVLLLVVALFSGGSRG